jgi:hypothetical protein
MVLPKERVPKLGIRWQGKSAISRGGMGILRRGHRERRGHKEKGEFIPHSLQRINPALAGNDATMGLQNDEGECGYCEASFNPV